MSHPPTPNLVQHFSYSSSHLLISSALLNGSLISSPWVKELGDLDRPHS